MAALKFSSPIKKRGFLLNILNDEDESNDYQKEESQPVSTQIPTQINLPKQEEGLYKPQLEKLIDMALADGELTEKEKQVLYKKAESFGIDLDEFEMVLDARLYEKTQMMQNAPAAAPSQQSAPQSNKFGDVKKCPGCGAMIQSFSTNCPDCGFEFRNIDANYSVQKLFDMLNVVENSESRKGKTYKSDLLNYFVDNTVPDDSLFRKKKAIIQNFPIPNTKDDILEFLTLAIPLAKKPKFFDTDTEKKEMYPVWKSKCEQIVMKAKFSMKDDPSTLEQILIYGREIGLKC